jgi:hypothetical protein
MSDIVKKTEQLPADFGANLMKGIEQTRSRIVTGGGKPFMRLTRAGDYIYGAQNIPVVDGSQWAVNLAALEHGYVCWGDGELLGQLMCSVQEPMPARPAPLEGYAFEEQFGMGLACVTQKGIEVIYKNNSLGYRKAFDQLLADIRARYVIDQQFYWPIIELLTSSYPHKKYGQIFEPVFKIVAWANAQGEIQSSRPRPVKVAAPEPAEAPEAPWADDEPEAPPAPRQGQRRRPTSR